MPPHFLAGESAYFLAISRNKKSVTLDLATPEGREIFLDLAKVSHAVVDNFRPGVMQRLGLTWESLREVNPRLVCCSISAYGSTGPLRDGPAFDLVIQALSGMMSYTGEPGRPPVRMGAPMGDLSGSMYAVLAVCAALYAAERTGEGREIDLGLLDCLVSMHTYVHQYYRIGGEIQGPAGSGHMSVVPYRAYRASDGFLVVAVFVDEFWARLCRAIGRPELAADPRYASAAARLERREEVDALLEGVFAGGTAATWADLLAAEGVPAAQVLRVDEALAHPQIEERGMLKSVEHPACGEIEVLGNPVRQPGVEGRPMAPPPLLGQHTGEVLGGLLGIGAERLRELEEQGIVAIEHGDCQRA